jgi:fibronectin type 3 domain-containing protein
MFLPQGIRPRFVFCLAVAFLAVSTAFGNIPGGGTGTGVNVTLVDNGSTVTIANGIVSILCTKSGATIDQINYTYNNGSGPTTTQVLAGGNNNGQLYWELGGFGSGTFTYSLVSNPAANGGNYAEISLLSSNAANGTMEVHFSMLRGSTGFYVTAIWNHGSGDAAMSMGETRDNIYAGSIFNWMSVDAARNRLMEVGNSFGGILVFNAPKEVTLWTNGIYQGQYEDKYCYSADLGVQRAWGWSSVGPGGRNIGLWNVSASAEYYNGGPMKRELMSHIGTTILNMHNGSHYGGGTDASWGTGEVWNKVYGPYFIYCNNVANTITDRTQASSALYADAMAQAAAEQTAWPYYWFTNSGYAPASGRGAIQGTMAIADSGNPNASAAGLWVGVVQQPSTTDAVYDFQEWMKPYQFWVKTDSNGNFTIPDVIAGGNYTLYSFGPGAAGTFQSQALNGGTPPITADIPSSPFSVTVTGGTTNNLESVVWTPTRVGSTVFEIGYPDRTGGKFRHGEDYWVGDLGPSASMPSPIWSKHLEYPFEFPSGPNYIVGQSRWTTDWNYVQPVVTDSAGVFNGSTSTITFNLASAPDSGAQASFYIALSSDYQGPLIIQVNGNNIAGSTGYFPAYSSSGSGSDTTIRQGIHGCFSDNRITFAGSLLQQGENTITINMRKGGYFANHAMYDYIRLELSGYVPPAPSAVAAYVGNNSALVTWPAVAGATSYNVLRSTTSGSGYTPVTNGVVGPVCGSGPGNATFVDSTAVNGTTYYYVVQSVNPSGTSGNSPQSAGVTPLGSIATLAPSAPTGLAATPGDRTVSLSWNPSAAANYYTIQRATVVNNGAGSYVTLGTITLNNSTTGTTYTDTTPTDGSIYNYFVSATSAGGASGNSAGTMARPLPVVPGGTVSALSASPSQLTNVALSWGSVAGAVGYVIQRATSLNGTYNLVASITETAYTDVGPQPTNGTFYYKIVPVNAAGTGANAITTTKPSAPSTVAAIPGNTQVTVNWSASAGATGYILKRGTSSGNETTTVASGIASTTYTDTGLLNGTRYYYVVASIGTGATSGNSTEVNAVPSVPLPATFTEVTFSSGNLNMTGSGGVTNGLYYVLCRTNWTGQWVPLATNQFNGNGNFSFTIPVNVGQPMMLFKLQSP